jgi:hypothetical protein
MPNKDLHHDLVIKILKKAGWTILNEHNFLSVGVGLKKRRRLFIDLRVRNKSRQIIFIEVKGLSPSVIHGFMELLGQYMVYQTSLEILQDVTPLYVAISLQDFTNIEESALVQVLLQKYPIRFMIYDEEKEEVVKWIPPL